MNNPNQNENQGYPNNSCPLSPVSSAFPPNSPFFNANEPGQKSNWVFCPKCNVYHRCPHPGCEHNPSKRTTTHKCIKDEDNQDQVQISNNSSQNMNNPNQNNPQNNINNSNNGPNMSTPNFNNNNFISFNPNAMGSNHGRMNQSQNSKKKPPRKRDVFSSCPYQEELGQFVDFLGFLMEVESKIEDMKIELARREDFNFEDIFRIFEVDGKGYIEPEDLKQGLKLLGLNPTDFDINLLLKRFDLNQQGLLTYSDFFDMVVSFEKKLRNSVQIRPPNSCCPCKSPDVFECDTLIAIKNLFKFIIDCEREINQIRANFDSLRSKYSDVVQFLDYTRRGIITRSDLKLYLTQFNKFTTSKECDLLFIRLDKTRSGEVGIDEIENELMFLR
jgi:Ca2+-binding EF-hand superfamily protein